MVSLQQGRTLLPLCKLLQQQQTLLLLLLLLLYIH